MLTQERRNKRPDTLMLNSGSAKHFTFLHNHFAFISGTVTVCTLYHGEVKKWIPGEQGVGLKGLGISPFSSLTHRIYQFLALRSKGL